MGKGGGIKFTGIGPNLFWNPLERRIYLLFFFVRMKTRNMALYQEYHIGTLKQ
jgi:hypothetical protein